MKKIREKVFETNSSSTNSFTLGKVSNDYIVPEELSTTSLEVGRNFCHDTIEARLTILMLLAMWHDRSWELFYRLQRIGVKVIHMDINDMENGGTGEINNVDEILNVLESDEALKGWLFSSESEISGSDDNDY